MKFCCLKNKRLLPWQKPLGVGLGQILTHQLLQQLVPVHLADHGTGVVVVGDIGGILGQDIADDLIDGIIALLLQRLIHCGQDRLDLQIALIAQTELAGILHLSHLEHLL